MRVEILSVGEELLTGALLDTNSAYLAQQCEIVGLEVARHTCVGDHLGRLVSVLKEIAQRSNIAIVSGGIGPTLDDRSREAAAAAANVELVLYPEILTLIEDFFTRLGRTMPETNSRQAFFPKSSSPLPNPIGTAPGFTFHIGSCHFFFIPGVPREMRLMLQEQVIPLINSAYSEQLEPLHMEILKTFGISEAVLGKFLESLEKLYPYVIFGTLANLPEIQIRLYSRKKKTLSELSLAKQAVVSGLHDWIFSEDGKSVESTVAEQLCQKGATLAVLEVENGGVIADLLTNIPQDSDFLSSMTIMNRAKFRSLIFSNSLSNLELIMQWAKKNHSLSGATYSIAIHNVTTEEEAHRSGEKIGTMHIGITDGKSTECYSCFLALGDRQGKKRMCAMLALDLLRRKICNQQPLSELFGRPIENKQENI